MGGRACYSGQSANYYSLPKGLRREALRWPLAGAACGLWPCFDEVAWGPPGFPFWILWGHFFNLLFLFILVRSGLSILMEHPRLYFNDHCTPGTEWIRFTPLRVQTDRIWTAKDDGRYISRWSRLPV